ncbi:MAG: phosphate ABC transporter permease PstA [Nitrososphaerota archaeon]|nr:phosphate ABC transporter permease PstA [Nitrososphaerales archaeon]MDW8044555.1 phosphate ABC transporter permease PstA [Nitrososphaerota archaeon]
MNANINSATKTRIVGGKRLTRKKVVDKSLYMAVLIAVSIGIIVLSTLLIDITLSGIHKLSPNIIFNYPSGDPNEAGMRPAILGSIWVVSLAIMIALPLGIVTGLYLSEFSRQSIIRNLIIFNLTNLAGVPSVIFGLVGLGFLSYTLGLGRTIIVGGITLAFLILPLTTVATIEAVNLVPLSHRWAGYALGATKVQVVFRIVLPQAFPSILTGTILAISRAMGEAAPLLIISGLLFIKRDPSSIFDSFTVMPLQIFNWIGRPQAAFRELSAASIIVMLAILLAMNVVAIYLRGKLQSRVIE